MGAAALCRCGGKRESIHPAAPRRALSAPARLANPQQPVKILFLTSTSDDDDDDAGGGGEWAGPARRPKRAKTTGGGGNTFRRLIPAAARSWLGGGKNGKTERSPLSQLALRRRESVQHNSWLSGAWLSGALPSALGGLVARVRGARAELEVAHAPLQKAARGQ